MRCDADLRIDQIIFDKAEESFSVSVNALRHFCNFLRLQVHVVFAHDVGKAEDAVEGCAEFVRYRGAHPRAKFLQFSFRPFHHQTMFLQTSVDGGDEFGGGKRFREVIVRAKLHPLPHSFAVGLLVIKMKGVVAVTESFRMAVSI